jgi:ligand-binding sensor domain-containing protein
MSIKLTIAAVIFLHLISHNGAAQKVQFDFNHITGANGISVGKVTSITQDKFGYMWFVDQTNQCITRFDGYRMKAYHNIPGDSNSLTIAGLEAIATDSTGNLWIGNTNGIDKFDPITNKFTHYVAGKKDWYVLNILVDHLGIIWMGTNIGLSRLDQKTGRFTQYVHNPNDSTSLSCDMVYSLYEDREGILWIGTGWPFGKVLFNTPGGGLNKFNRETGTFTSYMHDPKNPHSLINDKVRAIFEDSRGIFWVGTQGDGLHIMDRKRGTFQRLTYDPSHPEKLSRPPIKKGDDFDHIPFITEDGAGAIWVGTYSQGLVRYNPGTKEITHFKSDNLRPNGFVDSTSWCAFKSREGALWIATERSNLFRIDPFQTKFSYVFLNEWVWSFFEDSPEILLAGFEQNGMARIDGRKEDKKDVVYYRTGITDKRNSSANQELGINSIFPAGNGVYWVATFGGVYLFNSKKGSFTKIPYTDKKTGKDLEAISVINDNNNGKLYISGIGFHILDIKTGVITEYWRNPSDTNSISADTLVTAKADKENNLWIGTLNHGLNFFNQKTNRFRRYLQGLTVFCICIDTQETIWVGTDVGLYMKKKDENNFSAFANEESEFKTARISSLVEDDDLNIWGSSSLGIFRVNLLKKQSCIYGRKFGITLITGNKNEAIKTADGKILLGAVNGYYSFNPKEVINYVQPNIILTGFKIDGHPVIPGNNKLFDGPIEEAKEIRLNYKQNIFSIDFAAIHYSEPENNIHEYMLENYENTWRNVSLEKSAYYFNIPPGHYVFRIRANSRYGINSERAIDIIISPPWWQTWWFRITAAIFLISLIYGFMRWRIQQKFKLQLERSEKERQLAELKQKSTELEMQALRAQMNPHFIFNSLNSINRFILQNERAQASEYLTKFSKLVRLILQNSQASLITLDSELESLQLYLNLEALRFNYHFNYKISVPKDLDISALQVPPLILQPYVENAIWHGLMHKEEKGQLDVEVSEEDNHLFFKITDNGIGREKAAALASKSATKHKSMGLRITAHRIAMMQDSRALESPVTINDLTNADGSAAGTEVVIKMPVLYD